MLAAPTAWVLLGGAVPHPIVQGAVSLGAAQCTALKTALLGNAPLSQLNILTADWREGGLTLETQAGMSAPLPAHCDITGHYGERPGLVGGPYRTQFHMRLPAEWNGRFFFQGGGGSNGVIGNERAW